MIGLLRIRTAYVVIASDSHEWQAFEHALEMVHHIAEHFLMYFSLAAVALDKVAHLEDHPCLSVYKSRGIVEQSRTAA